VRYLATLLGSTDAQTMRYFMALLLDPAAVLFLLAATHWGAAMADQHAKLSTSRS